MIEQKRDILRVGDECIAYAIRGQGGMWLTELPTTFGHVPNCMPLLFGDAHKAVTVLSNLPDYPRSFSSVIEVEWKNRRPLIFLDCTPTSIARCPTASRE